MIKAKSQTIKNLSTFRVLTKEVFICSPSRYYIFGAEDFRSLVVEGRLNEQFKSFGAFCLPKAGDSYLTKIQDFKPDPDKKIEYFNALFANVKNVASFCLPKETLKTLSGLGRSKPTHIRIWGVSGSYALARPFDARKYYDKMIESERNKFDLSILSRYTGANFTTYIEYPLIKQLKKDNYEVSVLDNGILIFSATDTDLTYYIRDQRLGIEWINELSSTILDKTALLFHSKRAKAVRSKMKTQS